MKSTEPILRKSIRARIIDHYRTEIRLGKLTAGDRLPSARELARLFGTAEANVHHALAALVKEGMLMRRPKTGTVVTDRMERLTCVAIYLNWHYIQRGENFTRLLIEMLENRLAEEGIRSIVVYETPSQNGMERLKALAESREIQGVIVRSLRPDQYAFFSRLPVPFAAISAMRLPNSVTFSSADFARRLAKRLEQDGIHRVGILSSLNGETAKKSWVSSRSLFPGVLADHGFDLRPEWIYDGGSAGLERVLDSSAFAYAGFAKIWNCREHPEALLVFSDDMVGGLAMSFFQHRVNVPEDLRLYIHKTVENEIILPFPCVLMEQRISELADLLVRQLLDRSRGIVSRQKAPVCEFRDWTPVNSVQRRDAVP